MLPRPTMRIEDVSIRNIPVGEFLSLALDEEKHREFLESISERISWGK